jgi:GNAT superfamily N-acetyltransferase
MSELVAGDIVIGPLEDLAAMRRLGVACGLEDEGRGDEGILAAWGAFDGGRLIGVICLEHQLGLDTPNWMAVDDAYRGRGVASALYAELEREARRRGIRRLWVTARAPGFFLAQGFRLVAAGAERDVLLGECPQCPQYGRECTPEALCKPLPEDESPRPPTTEGAT